MDENVGRNFSPLNVYPCFSTTRRVMNKWISQSDSAHQIGPEPTLKAFLIVVGTWSAVGWKSILLSESFTPEFWVFWL
jgi:hypothetical protein